MKGAWIENKKKFRQSYVGLIRFTTKIEEISKNDFICRLSIFFKLINIDHKKLSFVFL
jgi:hypothetical protein